MNSVRSTLLCTTRRGVGRHDQVTWRRDTGVCATRGRVLEMRIVSRRAALPHRRFSLKTHSPRLGRHGFPPRSLRASRCCWKRLLRHHTQGTTESGRDCECRFSAFTTLVADEHGVPEPACGLQIFARKELNFERMTERDRKQIVAEVCVSHVRTTRPPHQPSLF